MLPAMSGTAKATVRRAIEALVLTVKSPEGKLQGGEPVDSTLRGRNWPNEFAVDGFRVHARERR